MCASVATSLVDGTGREGGRVIEMQRRRLLLAFAEILAERGLENAGVGKVCRRAGVSRRTFYELFDNREQCFLAVVDAAIERFSPRVLAAWEGEVHWRERVRAGLSALLECLEEEPTLALVCLVETLKGGSEVLERRSLVLASLAAVVDEGRLEANAAEPPPLTAEGTVGGVVSVLHARVLAFRLGAGIEPAPLVGLANQLVGMIVLPYCGPAAARSELDRPTLEPMHKRSGRPPIRPLDPFKDLPIRITFRTARVIDTICAHPGASNREIADTAGVTDQGQMSKLLRRLETYGLIENTGDGHSKGEANAWKLTEQGQAIQRAIEA